MRPTLIRVEGFAPYRNETIVPLSEGLTVIVGTIRGGAAGKESNGSGKSYLLRSIEVALYGAPPDLSLGDLVCVESDRMMVEATFQHHDALYRARRSHVKRGKGGSTTLDLERFDADGWVPLTCESIPATDRRIRAMLGMSADTFRASALMLRSVPSFVSLSSRTERADRLISALGLEEYEKVADEAGKARRAADSRIRTLADLAAADAETLARLPEQRQQLAGLASREAKTTADLAAAERDLDCRTAAAQEAQQRAAERRAAQAEADQAAEALRRLADRDIAATAAELSVVGALAELAGLASPDDVAAAEERYSEARAAYDTAMLERATLTAKLADAEQRWRDLTAEQQQLAIRVGQTDARAQKLQKALDNPSGEVCALCQRPHTDESAHREIEACWADLTTLDQRSRELLTAAREWETRTVALRDELATAGTVAAPSDHEVSRAREQLDRRARLEEHVKAWQQTIDAAAAPEHMDAKADALYQAETARQRLAALPPLDTAALDRVKTAEVSARGLVNLTRQQIDTLRQEKARLEADVDRLTILERKHAGEKQELEAQHLQRDRFAFVERMCGRDGVPSWIIERFAVPYLESESARILALLGTPWQVEVRLDRDVKSREGTRPALDYVIVLGSGDVRKFTACSTGEQTRVALALQVALARLLKRLGIDVEMIAIDEPDGLDAAGRSALLDLLSDLREEFPVQLIVSHQADLRDAVENVIEVEQEGGRSRVAESAAAGYAPEPVAA